MKENNGFSLIELLVVVAIIALLAAIAVPTYSQYSTRAKIISGFNVIWNVMQTMESTYNNTGAFPTSITIGGSSFSTSKGACDVHVINFSGISLTNLNYCISTDGKGIGINVAFNLSALGSNQSLYFGLRDVNGSIVRACGGNGGGADNAIITTYRPNNCTCQFIGTGWTTGFMNTGTGC